MGDFFNKCFVCNKEITKNNSEINVEVNLPVCNVCKGTKKEKETVEDYLDGMADDLICGCI